MHKVHTQNRLILIGFMREAQLDNFGYVYFIDPHAQNSHMVCLSPLKKCLNNRESDILVRKITAYFRHLHGRNVSERCPGMVGPDQIWWPPHCRRSRLSWSLWLIFGFWRVNESRTCDLCPCVQGERSCCFWWFQ